MGILLGAFTLMILTSVIGIFTVIEIALVKARDSKDCGIEKALILSVVLLSVCEDIKLISTLLLRVGADVGIDDG